MVRTAPVVLCALLLPCCWRSVAPGASDEDGVDAGDDASSEASADSDSDSDSDSATDPDTDCPDESATIFLTASTTPFGEFAPTSGAFTWSGGGECAAYVEFVFATEPDFIVNVEDIWKIGAPAGEVLLLRVLDLELMESPSDATATVSGDDAPHVLEVDVSIRITRLDETPWPLPPGEAPRSEGTFSIEGAGWNVVGEFSLPFCRALGTPPCV